MVQETIALIVVKANCLRKSLERTAGGKYKLEIAPFDHIEEVVIIRGLPLTDDIERMEEKIKEAIQPFVKEVKRMEACKHREGNRNMTGVEEFFKDKYNGMWRVVVETK